MTFPLLSILAPIMLNGTRKTKCIALPIALMEASQSGHKEIVELLIEKGADVNQKDNNGRTALIIAKDDKTKKAIIEAVKKKHEKTGENVIVQGFERE
jgi:ankyrin repeat protein